MKRESWFSNLLSALTPHPFKNKQKYISHSLLALCHFPFAQEGSLCEVPCLLQTTGLAALGNRKGWQKRKDADFHNYYWRFRITLGTREPSTVSHRAGFQQILLTEQMNGGVNKHKASIFYKCERQKRCREEALMSFTTDRVGYGSQPCQPPALGNFVPSYEKIGSDKFSLQDCCGIKWDNMHEMLTSGPGKGWLFSKW